MLVESIDKEKQKSRGKYKTAKKEAKLAITAAKITTFMNL